MEYDLEYQKYLTKVKDYGGWVLEYVPKDLRTEEVCLIAVKDFPYALKFVPDELKTKELCELAVNDGHWALEFVPEDLKSPELCLIAVGKNGYQLAYVPDGLKTYELCELAVERSREWAMDYVPEEFQEELAEKYNVKLPDKAQSR